MAGNSRKVFLNWGEWAILLAENDVAMEKVSTAMGRLGTLLPYLTTMSKDDYSYTGSGKAVGGKRAIVFWYRNPEKQLRAVFSDFTPSLRYPKRNYWRLSCLELQEVLQLPLQHFWDYRLQKCFLLSDGICRLDLLLYRTEIASF